MKVTLRQITMVQIDVELPTTCPACGAKFCANSDENLIEDHWVFRQQSCRMRRTRGSEIVRPQGRVMSINGTPIVTGYRCGKCRETLCSTDEGRDVFVHHSTMDNHG
jgi:DNA-directed RNA polymerase subunit RPC12/RpoP